MSSRCASACLLLLLTACATAPAGHGDVEPPQEMTSWEQARADPSCMVPLCQEARCALWRCADLRAMTPAEVALAEQARAAEERLEAGRVISVRGPLVHRPPASWTHSGRYWGYPVTLPGDRAPVFEIPWNNWKHRAEAERLSAKHWWCLPPKEPLEKHHIFPQQRILAVWFARKGINIHDFTIPLTRSLHTYIHSGGQQGGLWNEAWRQFKDANEEAPPEEIWRFAGELMMRFRLYGEFVPYCERPESQEARDL